MYNHSLSYVESYLDTNVVVNGDTAKDSRHFALPRAIVLPELLTLLDPKYVGCRRVTEMDTGEGVHVDSCEFLNRGIEFISNFWSFRIWWKRIHML